MISKKGLCSDLARFDEFLKLSSPALVLRGKAPHETWITIFLAKFLR
jgi:hypothetical protein